MALYGRRVVLPALRLESKRADAATPKLLREVRPQMMRDYVRADEGARLALSSVRWLGLFGQIFLFDKWIDLPLG
ncbi:MAG: hypothetical protein ACREXS_20070 [Gammaproteobacteria bacterium]